jgi:6-phosphogluconate dehydrogenase
MGDEYLVDKVLDKTGMKGTGKWTVQQVTELSLAATTPLKLHWMLGL